MESDNFLICFSAAEYGLKIRRKIVSASRQKNGTRMTLIDMIKYDQRHQKSFLICVPLHWDIQRAKRSHHFSLMICRRQKSYFIIIICVICVLLHWAIQRAKRSHHCSLYDLSQTEILFHHNNLRHLRSIASCSIERSE